MERKNLSQKIAAVIIKFRLPITIVFGALLIFSSIMIPKTKVLYDMSGYVPKGSQTEKAVAVMKKEFDDKGSAIVLVPNTSVVGAQTIKAELEQIEGIASATVQDFKDSNALFSITLDGYDSTDEANAALQRLADYLEDKDAQITGQAFASYSTRKVTEREIVKTSIVIAILVVFILFFTSKSFFEILVLAFVFGTAALINIGTHFILGKVSYLSYFVSLILQLVLAIDYSVVLMHRFVQERETQPDAIQAAKLALKKAIPEVLSSSLTTVAGMCALMLMTLPIGFELGLVLAKGIIISLLTVILFMPHLLIISAKLIDKTLHKSFVPNVEKPVKKIFSAKKIIVPVFLVATVLAFIAQNFNSYTFNMNRNEKVDTANFEITKVFGSINTLAVIVPNEQPQKQQQLIYSMLSNPKVSLQASLSVEMTAQEIAAALGSFMPEAEFDIDDINFMFDYYNAANDTTFDKISLSNLIKFALSMPDAVVDTQYKAQLNAILSNFESAKYTRMLFYLNSEIEGKETFDLIEDIQLKIDEIYDEYYLAGESLINYEMNKAFPSDNFKVVIFTASFILLILFAAFKNYLLPFILTLTIQGGVWINFAIPYLTDKPMLFIGYLLVSAIQMGATIDYAIILTSRFRDLKNSIGDKNDAMAKSINLVYPTIVTSGSILTLAGFLLNIMTTEPVIKSIGLFLGLGTLLSMLLVLFVLPSFLLLSEKLVDKAALKKSIK